MRTDSYILFHDGWQRVKAVPANSLWARSTCTHQGLVIHSIPSSFKLHSFFHWLFLVSISFLIPWSIPISFSPGLMLPFIFHSFGLIPHFHPPFPFHLFVPSFPFHSFPLLFSMCVHKIHRLPVLLSAPCAHALGDLWYGHVLAVAYTFCSTCICGVFALCFGLVYVAFVAKSYGRDGDFAVEHVRGAHGYLAIPERNFSSCMGFSVTFIFASLELRQLCGLLLGSRATQLNNFSCTGCRSTLGCPGYEIPARRLCRSTSGPTCISLWPIFWGPRKAVGASMVRILPMSPGVFGADSWRTK